MLKQMHEILNQHITIFHPQNNLRIDIKLKQFSSISQLADFCFAKLPLVEQNQFQKNRDSAIKDSSEQLSVEYPYLKEWQHLISLHIIELGYYSRWSDLSLKLNLYKRCSHNLRSKLESWYKDLKNKNNLNLLESSIQSEDIIWLSPTIDKLETIDLEKAKNYILAYIERYLNGNKLEMKKPLVWNNIYENLFRDHYQFNVILPLKKWYNHEFLVEWSAKFSAQSSQLEAPGFSVSHSLEEDNQIDQALANF